MRPKLSEQANTKQKLIDLASDLMRQKGYSAFSYADLADEIGIRKASIHHHFPSKADLGVAVAMANCDKIQAGFSQITEQYQTLNERLSAYVAIFADNERLPMCASLSADKSNLPDELITHTKQHFEMQLAWLENIINQAIKNGEIGECNAQEKALMILNLCEGATIVSRGLNDFSVFERTKGQILASFD